MSKYLKALKQEDVPWERFVLYKLAYNAIRTRGYDAAMQEFADALHLIPIGQLEPALVELAGQIVSTITPDTPSYYRGYQAAEEKASIKKPGD